MPKLITPVQYEPSLEGLNVLRPLSVPDEGKTLISYPVLCQNLPSEGRPGVGKLARCTQQGALLKSNKVFADKIYERNVPLTHSSPHRMITFPSVVYGVLVKRNPSSKPVKIYWRDNNYYNPFLLLSLDYQYVSFMGNKMYFTTNAYDSAGESRVFVVGFYK